MILKNIYPPDIRKELKITFGEKFNITWKETTVKMAVIFIFNGPKFNTRKVTDTIYLQGLPIVLKVEKWTKINTNQAVYLCNNFFDICKSSPLNHCKQKSDDGHRRFDESSTTRCFPSLESWTCKNKCKFSYLRSASGDWAEGTLMFSHVSMSTSISSRNYTYRHTWI